LVANSVGFVSAGSQMSSSTDEEEVEKLRERVHELEDVVEDLTTGATSATDDQGREWNVGDLLELGLSRREALFAIGALASGYAFREAIVSAIGTAEAAEAEGAVGSQSQPLDIYANRLLDPSGDTVYDSQDGSLSVKQVLVNSRSYQNDWAGTKTVTVDPNGGADYTSLQSALKAEIPLRFVGDARVKFEVAAGKVDEDVFVPPYIPPAQNSSAGDGATLNVIIEGDAASPTDHEIGSVYSPTAATGVANPTLRGLTVTRETPYTNDPGAMVFQGGSGANVVDCALRAEDGQVTRTVISYGSRVKVDGFDYGDNQTVDGVYVKRDGYIVLRGSHIGTVDDGFMTVASGEITTNADESGLLDNNRIEFEVDSGVVYDELRSATYTAGKAVEPIRSVEFSIGADENIELLLASNWPDDYPGATVDYTVTPLQPDDTDLGLESQQGFLLNDDLRLVLVERQNDAGGNARLQSWAVLFGPDYQY